MKQEERLELVRRIVEMQEDAHPIKIGIGYVRPDDNHCDDESIVIYDCPHASIIKIYEAIIEIRETYSNSFITAHLREGVGLVID